MQKKVWGWGNGGHFLCDRATAVLHVVVGRGGGTGFKRVKSNWVVAVALSITQRLAIKMCHACHGEEDAELLHGDQLPLGT